METGITQNPQKFIYLKNFYVYGSPITKDSVVSTRDIEKSTRQITYKE